LLSLSWFLVGAAVVVAALALERVRRLSKRLERLRESYWDLRYEIGQLQTRVNRLDPEQPDRSPSPQPGGGINTFVPLSSLKR
jgi:hypothetical protein